jgi:serine protease Do
MFAGATQAQLTTVKKAMSRLTMSFITSLAWLVVVLFSGAAHAAKTEEVFKLYKDRLLQVRSIDKSTNSKSTIGSGFYVDNNGTIATNYHVISKHVFKPEQYRIEYFTQDNKTYPADLIYIDVVHDLALLSGSLADTPSFKILEGNIEKGVRIYTLGNPLDLGMTIVEGTYNGLTDDTMHERILLSSALNSGMSGGPSINGDGDIIGVNVATAGNSIGFLVPAKFLGKLIAEAKAHRDEKDFLKIIQQQLIDNQKRYMDSLLSTPIMTKKLGPYTAPAKLADYITCWGDSKDADGTYTKSSSYCATKNDIFLNSRLSTGEIKYIHTFLESEKMNSFRFAALMQSYFEDPSASFSGHKEDFTEYQCKTDYIKHADIKFKVAFCLREYKKLEGIYDMILNAATLTENNRGIVTSLGLSGVSYENAVNFSKHYLESFAWKRPSL